ncbi:MAG TPA: GAF domain-containing protein [Bryobacteraceae bacterium]|nr:GAF domain-containing protein [Bryobacteraceae bacterium]
MAEVSKSRSRFRERAELLDFLLEVSSVTAETLDLDQLLENVATIVRGVIPFELFAILLSSERPKGLKIRYAMGHRPEVVRNMVISLGEGLTGIAAETRQPVMTGEVRNDPRYLSGLDAVRSELAVPMIARGKLVGVIDVESTKTNAYTAHDRALLQLIAGRVGFSIENARLYRRVERQNRLLKTLSSVSQEFSSILAVDELLRKIAAIIRKLVNYDAFSLLLVDEERKVLRHHFSLRYDQRVEIDNIPLGSGITGAAVAAREPVKVRDTLADPRYISSHPGIKSEVAVPLFLHDRVIGVLDLESERMGFFTDDHVRVLSLLAPQVASSVENARLYEELASREQRMEQDLRAARKLQKILLPRTAPDIEGLEIALGARPAREISGDIYDFFARDECRFLLCFGDSSGKSAAAALYGALVSGLLRSMAQSEKSPSALMAMLNEALLERKVETKYVTLLLMLWNAKDRTFTMTNAGNTQPMICRGDEIIVPKVEGIPVGLLEDVNYDEVIFQAEPGDLVLLYSDGVQDQQRPADDGEEQYGTKRLSKLLRKVKEKPAAELVGAIFRDLDLFAAGAPINDDQSIILMKVC